MASTRDTDGNPIDRAQYAARLEKQLTDTDRSGNLTVTNTEAQVVAELLDELAAVYENEDLGRLARVMALRFYDRLGI